MFRIIPDLYPLILVAQSSTPYYTGSHDSKIFLDVAKRDPKGKEKIAPSISPPTWEPLA